MKSNNRIFEDIFNQFDEEDIEDNISSFDNVDSSVKIFPNYELCFGNKMGDYKTWFMVINNILSPNNIKKFYNRISNLRYMDNVIVRFQANDQFKDQINYEPDESKFSEYNLMTPEELYDYIANHKEKNDYVNLYAMHIYYDKPNINTDDVSYAIKLITEAWDLFIDIFGYMVNSSKLIESACMTAWCLKKNKDDNRETGMMSFWEYLYIKNNKYNDDVLKHLGYILPIIDCYQSVPLDQRDINYYDIRFEKIINAIEKKPQKMKITVYNALRNSGFSLNILKKIKFDIIKSLGIIMLTIPEDTTISLKNISLGSLLSDFNKMNRVRLRVEGTLLVDDISAYDCLNYIDKAFDNNEIVVSAPRTKRIMDLINNIGFKKIIEK